LIDEQRRAEEEHATRESLRAIQRAFREAMLVLPREEYDWFEIQSPSSQGASAGESAERGLEEASGPGEEGTVPGASEPGAGESGQRQFFDYAGPLHSVMISPTASTLAVNQSRRFRALPRDRSRRRVEQDLAFAWGIAEGCGTLSSTSDQEVSFGAPSSPGLVRLTVTASQRDVRCSADHHYWQPRYGHKPCCRQCAWSSGPHI
jgi:hypothetical protein